MAKISTLQHIYICCRVKYWSKFFFFFPFMFYLDLLPSWLMRFFKKAPKKDQKWPLSWVKIGPIMLRNMLGLIFDSSLDQCLTQGIWHFGAIFGLFKNMPKPLFIYCFQQQMHFESPPPKIGNTICEHNRPNSKRSLLFSAFFIFFRFCCVWLCFAFFWRGMKTPQNKNWK